MKHSKLAVSITLLVVAFVQAVQGASIPALGWQRSFSGGDGETLSALKQTADGGYLLAGISYTMGISVDKTTPGFDGQGDYWIVRTDAGGNKLWDRTFGGNSYDYLTCMATTSDGGCILGGYSASGVSGNKTTTNKGGEDYYVVRLDANGNKLWEKSFGGDNSDIMTCIIRTSNDGFLLGGYSISGVSGDKSSPNTFVSADYWVVKIDQNGNKEWDRSFGGSDTDQLKAVCQTTDGGFLLGGYSISPASLNKTTPGFGQGDFWIVKVDQNGNKLWEKSYGGSDTDELTSLQPTADGGYILGGWSWSGISGNKTSTNLGYQDFLVVKIDSLGNKLWDKSYGGDNYDKLNSIGLTTDGGFILGGWSWSGISGTNKTTPTYGFGDYLVIKTDAQGNKLWDQTFGGSDTDELTSLQQTTDGGFVLGGYSWSGASGNKTTPTLNGGAGSFWVIKLDPPPPLILSPMGKDTNGYSVIHLTGPDGSYTIKASTNFINWVTVTNLIHVGTNPTVFVDTQSTNYPSRFYRAMGQ